MTIRNQSADEQLREQLSALMDGELPRDQSLFLLKRMESDLAMRDEWERMHQIRDGFNAVPQRASVDFCARVMSAIDAEIPASGKPALLGKATNMPRWLQTMAGGAVAAGVAWVALISSAPQLHAPSSSPALASNTATTATTVASPGSAATGAMLLPQQVFSQASQTSGGTPATVLPANLKLDRYLLRHSQALQHSIGAQPLAPYVYAVSFSDRAPLAQQAR